MQLIDKIQQAWQKSALPGFFKWWSGQLLSMMPQNWQDWLNQTADQLWVCEEESGVVLYKVGKEGKQSLLTFESMDELINAKAKIAQILAGFGKQTPKLWLMLKQNQTLNKVIRVPAAVQADLHHMLGFEMDKHTPFKASEVYFDYNVKGQHGAMISVDLVLLPKQDISQLVQNLVKAGLALDGIGVMRGGIPDALNLLPKEARTVSGGLERRNLAALGILAIGLVATAMWLHVDMLDQRLEALREAQTEATKSAKDVMALRKNLDSEIKAAGYIVREKEEKPSLIKVLADLTHATPDDSWVQRLEIKGTEVKAQGQSAAANVLLEKLGHLKGYKNVQIQGAVTEDRKTHLERFTIKMEATETVNSEKNGIDEQPINNVKEVGDESATTSG
ncbi:MAG: PilN domain-containing protein [bacterium]